MELDLSQHFCPNPDCQDYGRKGLGNISTSTTFGKKNIQLLRCKTCNKVLSELLKDLNLTECQLDELWAFIKKRVFTNRVRTKSP